MPKMRLAKLSDFRPQAINANQHTERGMALLESSMRQDGFFDGMTATADGEIIDGSARIEKSAVVFDEDVIVLEHDGTKPIVEVRTDIQTADDPRAKRIALAANRVAQVNLKFDPQVLKGLQDELDLTPMWNSEELKQATAEKLLGFNYLDSDDPITAIPAPAAEQDRIPLSIVLNTYEVRQWRDYKERIDTRDDKAALLILLREHKA